MEASNKTFVITGGASGIGLAIARLAAQKGASVVLLGRTEAKLVDYGDGVDGALLRL